jgi:predicted transcriptional regulator
MTIKKITVTTGSREQASREFIEAWRKAEAGHIPEQPVDKISFGDQRLLFQTLTPRRFELLRHVHEHGASSIRAISKELQRDYSNVHQDVRTLYDIGLMVKDNENMYSVPWDIIVTEIPLTVIHNQSKKHPRSGGHGDLPPRAAHG